ncbi:unnamed protein product, partial [Ectocarpus sp. 13 AM-2016]
DNRWNCTAVVYAAFTRLLKRTKANPSCPFPGWRWECNRIASKRMKAWCVLRNLTVQSVRVSCLVCGELCLVPSRQNSDQVLYYSETVADVPIAPHRAGTREERQRRMRGKRV